MNSQSHIRQQTLTKRRALSPAQVDHASAQVLQQLLQLEIFQHSFSVACYFSVGNEVNTLPIIELLLQQGKSCFLPKIVEQTNTMSLVRYQEGDPLQKNRFGILEPSRGETLVDLDELDLLLLPLVAFDKSGARIGMGKGYYDRLLANKKQKPFTCGLAYDFQQYETLPTNSWDVALDQILVGSTTNDC